MPYGVPASVPSARLDLTQYALKNLKRYAGVGVNGDGNPNNFLKAYRNTLVTDLADRTGPPFNRDVYQSADDGATWAVFYTVGVNSSPNAMCFQWNNLGNALTIILAHGTTSGNSGVDVFNGAGVWSALTLNTGVQSINDVQTADRYGYGMNADGTTFQATIIAVGNTGGIWRSIDGGNTWSARASGTAISLVNVVSSGGGVWVAVGAGVICRSIDDGLTWSATAPAIIPTKVSFSVSNGKFVGIRNSGGTGQILTSLDGLSWDVVFSRAVWGIYCIDTDQKGITIAGGDAGSVVISRDLVTWTTLVLANNPTSGSTENLAANPISGVIRVRTLSFDGSYQSNLLTNNRWLLSCTNQGDTIDNPLLGAANLLNASA